MNSVRRLKTAKEKEEQRKFEAQARVAARFGENIVEVQARWLAALRGFD